MKLFDYINYISTASKELMHYGVGKLNGAPGRGSGRYPLGSGKNPNQRSGDFLSRYNELRRSGMSETEIAEYFDISTTELRVRKQRASHEDRERRVATAKRLRDEGLTPTEIAKKMGYANESSVRALLNENTAARKNQAKVTAEYLKEVADQKGMVDVGAGVERELGVSKEKLKEALDILQEEGYSVYGIGIPQPTNPGQQSNTKVLCVPGTPYKDAYNFDKLYSVKDYDKILTENGDAIRPAFAPPTSFDSSRLMIRYAEEGGEALDGLIQIRRGVEDISLGGSNYAQVRILTDDTLYMKGMAVYSDDMPDGVDIIFNTNKSIGTPIEKVLKPIEPDPDNPFGALIKDSARGGQRYYDDPDGIYIDPITGHKQSLSCINKVRDEGDWNDWAHTVPSQFLGKQSQKLIDNQLKLTLLDTKAEYEEICALTNPTVKKVLLKKFADQCDADAVDLQAISFPRQRYQVILPGTTIPDNQVYAPNYKDGEKVALVRFPYANPVETPILTVNNKLQEGKDSIGTNPLDAIIISKNVADRMSGADFDGDTVAVIPLTSNVKIKSKSYLQGLEPGSFDPKKEYGPDSTDKPYKRLSKEATQIEMGKISNLITDMTLQGASDEQIARAIKHSMVVIDAHKHNLDWRRSELDNNIAQLRAEYQPKDESGRGGAATLLSRASAPEYVTKRQGSGRINEKGKPWYDPTRPEGVVLYKTVDNPYYVNKKGKTVERTQESTRMAETDDAYTLISKADTPQERAYAEFANQKKAFAQQARMEMLRTKSIEYDASAKKTYQAEVDSLEAKLRLAELNAPRERRALAIANANIKAKMQAYPDMDKKQLKKLRQRETVAAREKVGAHRQEINITDREWQAIQSGAISETKLKKILERSNMDQLRQRATPRSTNQLSDAKKQKIQTMKQMGYTNSVIADTLGVSPSTVTRCLKGE